MRERTGKAAQEPVFCPYGAEGAKMTTDTDATTPDPHSYQSWHPGEREQLPAKIAQVRRARGMDTEATMDERIEQVKQAIQAEVHRGAASREGAFGVYVDTERLAAAALRARAERSGR